MAINMTWIINDVMMLPMMMLLGLMGRRPLTVMLDVVAHRPRQRQCICSSRKAAVLIECYFVMLAVDKTVHFVSPLLLLLLGILVAALFTSSTALSV